MPEAAAEVRKKENVEPNSKIWPAHDRMKPCIVE
jgi:hypothetical protein